MMIGMGIDFFWADYEKYGYTDADFEEEISETTACELDESTMIEQDGFVPINESEEIDKSKIINNKHNIFDINEEDVEDIEYREV